HWGHAVSDDLVHWRHLPVVLGPVPGGPENLCCQTGSLAADGDTPTAIYTCAPGVCIATSSDGLKSWQRNPDNPVIPGPPEGHEVTGYRDPYV
ncbi:MAG: glycoside hydrolase family 32 protein, partial [bacterium]|nr:glycoside hydrolase family 32 protein [bacterium]